MTLLKRFQGSRMARISSEEVGWTSSRDRMTVALPVIGRVESRWTADALDARVAAGNPFPIVEPNVCTFAYRGPVVSVQLVHFGVGLPDDLSFEQLGDGEWWVLALAIPDGTRLEYKLDVFDSFGKHFIDDPLNSHLASHPFGVNSVCESWGYVKPLWARHADDVPVGTFTDITVWSAEFGRDTSVTVYRSASVNGPAPLIVVHDGGDYLRYAVAGTVLDNLVHGGVMPPVVAAFVQPGERLVEYAGDPRHAAYLTDELLPRVEADFGAVGEPWARCLVGASFGAVACLAAAAATPGHFGRLLLQSGSFAGAGIGCRPRPEPLWNPVKQFVAGFLARPQAVSERVFVSCGAFESLICENRALVPVLGRDRHGRRFRGVPRRTQLGLLAGQHRVGDLPWLLSGEPLGSARGRRHSPHRALTRRRPLLADLLRGDPPAASTWPCRSTATPSASRSTASRSSRSTCASRRTTTSSSTA